MELDLVLKKSLSEVITLYSITLLIKDVKKGPLPLSSVGKKKKAFLGFCQAPSFLSSFYSVINFIPLILTILPPKKKEMQKGKMVV